MTGSGRTYVHDRDELGDRATPLYGAQLIPQSMTVNGQLSCPPADNFVAVTGQFLVAADSRRPVLGENTPAIGTQYDKPVYSTYISSKPSDP